MDISKKLAPQPATSRRPLALLSLILLLVASLICRPAQVQATQTIPQEYELKAVYLYNFLQFISWPTGPCTTAGRVKEIAVLGDSPIGESLKSLQAELKRSRGVEISLRFYGPYVEGMDLSGCQLLFITQPELKHLKKILESLKGKTDLLVADDEDCLEQGCMIALLAQSNNKIRWAVNRRTVEASGLKMNSRILEMALKVVE